MRFKMTQGDIDKAWNLILKKGSHVVSIDNCPVANTLIRYGFEDVEVNGVGFIDTSEVRVKQSQKLEEWIHEFDRARFRAKEDPTCNMSPIVFDLAIPKEYLPKRVHH